VIEGAESKALIELEGTLTSVTESKTRLTLISTLQLMLSVKARSLLQLKSWREMFPRPTKAKQKQL
jgi:hypothetical protein